MNIIEKTQAVAERAENINKDLIQNFGRNYLKLKSIAREMTGGVRDWNDPTNRRLAVDGLRLVNNGVRMLGKINPTRL